MTTPYTQAQIKELKDQGKVDLQMAKKFADTWKKSQKSVIAKCASMGIYHAKPR